MRIIKLVFCLLLISNVTPIIAQFSVGQYVQFPDGGFIGSAFKPKLAIAQQNVDDLSMNYIVLHFISPTDYANFNEESRILIKFSDDTKYTITRTNDNIEKDYDNQYIQSTLVKFYSTYTIYHLDDNILDKILQGINIIKIRLVFTNGDIQDYIIDEYYQKKFIKKLKESYFDACQKNTVRKQNMNDDDF